MTTLPIPLSNPKASYLEHQEAFDQTIKKFLDSGYYILGPEVQGFETAFAGFVGLKHCITVNNGTDAIVLTLRALGIGAGDEVITVSHTAVATVAAIEEAGAIPVLVDVDAQSYCLNPNLIEVMISEKTKAILPVHLYGNPANMPEIMKIARKHGLLVVEDCAQAHGAKINGQMVGTFGDAACFSFYPTKNLGAFGDGGAVLTNDSDTAERLRLLRQYGWKDRYVSNIVGVNTRMDELQAAILNIKLPFLEADNRRRAQIAMRYHQALQNLPFQLPNMAENTEHVWHLYVIQSEDRDNLQRFLQENQIGFGIHYPQAVHQQPAYLGRLRGSDNLPVTEALIPRILSLPMYPQLAMEDVDRVIEALKAWAKQR